MKNSRFNFNRKAAVLCAVFAFVIGLTSCQWTPKTYYHDEDLNGSWVSSYYEEFNIDIDNQKFDNGSYSYAGDNLVIKFTGSDRGYIYFKYTKSYEAAYTEPVDVSSWTISEYWINDATSECVYKQPEDLTGWTYYSSWYRYSASAPDAGKWYAISFKNLSESSVQFSGAYGSKEGHKLSSVDTLDEAKEEFTIENGYFSYYSDCTRK